MKRSTAFIIFAIFVILCILGIFISYKYYTFIEEKKSYNVNETFTVANWNLQIFGDKKANDTELMNFYAQTISHYNIVFVQEIRDKDSNSFDVLCSMLTNYKCAISSRAGRSSSKEQYGIIYLKDFTLVNITDFNPDPQNRWERPPIKADFIINNYSITFYNIHTKPDDTPNEIKYMEQLIIKQNNENNIVVLGDLNADCSYYTLRSDFSNWQWIIKNTDDTTSGPSDCAYDRIIANQDAYGEFVDYGIYRSRITSQVTDHYLVWARFRNYEYYSDTSFKKFIEELI